MIVVLSPHCDDAALSLGAWIAAKTDARQEVHVVTVFGNDLETRLPLSDWDRRAGFRNSIEAARARRQEDIEALSLLGASVEHLPFPDSGYLVGRRDEDEVVEALAATLDRASVILAPGFPLVHGDHRWLTDVVVRRFDDGHKLAFYTEQPYAWWSRRSALDGLHIVPAAARWRHVRRKVAAVRCYRSQVPLLGGSRVVPRLLAVDLLGHGEKLRSWPDVPGGSHSVTLGHAELLTLAAA